MPHYHCSKCHHEFEDIPMEGLTLKCDWCGAKNPTILEEETPLEKMIKNRGAIIEELIKLWKKGEFK